MGTTCPAPPWSQHYIHNPASCTSRCPLDILSVSLVPILCTSPSVAKALRFAILFGASPCSLWEPQGGCACLVVRCSRSRLLATCLGSVREVLGSLCSVLRHASRLWWCVQQCPRGDAGDQGGSAWWHAGL